MEASGVHVVSEGNLVFSFLRSNYAKTLGFDESGPWLRVLLMKGMAEARKKDKSEPTVWKDQVKDKGTIKGRDDKSRWMGFRKSLVECKGLKTTGMPEVRARTLDPGGLTCMQLSRGHLVVRVDV